VKVTTVDRTDPGCPKLFAVLIDGKPIGGGKSPRDSKGRVLKSPWGWMPILDGAYIFGMSKTRTGAARMVADKAAELPTIYKIG